MRPTSDRVREAIFNLLAHGDYLPIEGARVLDLFAGTGALAMEALSRGADRAVLVDNHAASRALIRRNAGVLGLREQIKVHAQTAIRLGSCPEEPFTLIFADPPYGSGLGEKALSSAHRGGWIGEGGTIILELDAAEKPPEPDWATLADCRTYGGTQVVLMRARMRSSPAAIAMLGNSREGSAKGDAQ